jgi:hypothetical protein
MRAVILSLLLYHRKPLWQGKKYPAKKCFYTYAR